MLKDIVTDLELSRELKDAGMEQDSVFAWYQRASTATKFISSLKIPVLIGGSLYVCDCWTLAELLAHPLMADVHLCGNTATNYRAERFVSEGWLSAPADTPTQAAGKLLLALLKKSALERAVAE